MKLPFHLEKCEATTLSMRLDLPARAVAWRGFLDTFV